MSIDTKALRDLLAAATPGEWEARRAAFESGERELIVTFAPHNFVVAEIMSDETWTRDGTFIAAAHNALPALLDELDALRQQLADARTARDAAEAERDEALQHGAAMEAKYSRLYDVTAESIDAIDYALSGLKTFGMEVWTDVERELRAAAAKLKEAQS